MSPKAQKRLKLEEKHTGFASLLRPINQINENLSTDNFSTQEVDVDFRMLDERSCKDHNGLN